jgi:hypothetical protein
MKTRNKLGQFIKGSFLGKDNYNWNENAGYHGVHFWVYRTLGKPKKCLECGVTERLQWANISGKYKREIDDWKSLCVVCHRKFDGLVKLSKEQADEIKKRYNNGEKQYSLASEFNVNQSTISLLVNGKTQSYV